MTTGMHNEDGAFAPKKTYREQLMDVRSDVAHLVVTFNTEHGDDERLVMIREEAGDLQRQIKELMISRSTDRKPLSEIGERAEDLWEILKEIRNDKREAKRVEFIEKAMQEDLRRAAEQRAKKSNKFYIFFRNKVVQVGYPDPEKLPTPGAPYTPTIIRAHSEDEAMELMDIKKNGGDGLKIMHTAEGVEYWVKDGDARTSGSTPPSANQPTLPAPVIEGYRAQGV